MREMIFPVEIFLDKEKWDNPPQKEGDARTKIMLGPGGSEGDVKITQKAHKDKKSVLFWAESREEREAISAEAVAGMVKSAPSFWILGRFRCDTLREFNEIAP